MNINQVGDPSNKKHLAGNSAPDPTKFQKELRIEKVDGVDPDQKKKGKRWAESSTSEDRVKTRSTGSIYTPEPAKRFGARPLGSKVKAPVDKNIPSHNLPQNPSFWREQSDGKKNKEQKGQIKKEVDKKIAFNTKSFGTKKNDLQKSHDEKDCATVVHPMPNGLATNLASTTPDDSDNDQSIDNGQQESCLPEKLELKKQLASPHKSSQKEDIAEDLSAATKNCIAKTNKENSEQELSSKQQDETSSSSSLQEKKNLNKEQKNFLLKTANKKQQLPLTTKKIKQIYQEAEKKYKHLHNMSATLSPPVPIDSQDTQLTATNPLQGEISPIPLTPGAVGYAAEAASNALLPRSIDLIFTQMVAAIVVMQTQEITRTEVFLDTLAFQSDLFHGASLVVEKYASAPDSFNIQLVGTTQQQVNTFIEGLPDLYNAFEKGKFLFRIGRLEAAYDPDRPLFRRKGKAQQKGTDSGLGGQK